MILFIRQFLDGIKIEVKVLHEGCVEFIYSHLVEMKPSFLKTLFLSYPEITYTSQASKIFSAVADSAWRE